MPAIKKFITIITFFQILLLNFCYGSENEPKSYYVKPIDVVCDYLFNDTTKWAITCRVWGLLKYYHPNVATGKLDWDEVLIKWIDKINEAKTVEQANTELMQMIQIAGEYKFIKDTTKNESLNMNVNLCWLDNSFINDSIRQTLRAIAFLPINQPSHYIKMDESRGIPMPNEKDYGLYVISQYEYRLLSLFRYWNVIYYFYPYKYLMDQSWDETLLEFIPQFINAFDAPSYYRAVSKLATRLNDGHAFTTVTPANYRCKVNYLTLIDSSTVVRIPPEGSFLESGDIILSMNEKNIMSVRDSISAFIPSSNKHYMGNYVNCRIYISIIDGCTLTVMRNQQVVTINEERKPYPIIASDSTSYDTISPDIGYVNLDFLKSADIPDMMESMKDYKGIIFDLRNYPSHFRAWDLLSHLSSTQEYCFALATLVDMSYYGAFYEDECITKCPDELWQRRKKYNGRVVVLINAMSISWAETLAMRFRYHGSTLIGTPTAGANGNTAEFSLSGVIKVSYSALGFYYSNGEQTQRKGIIPDIEVYPTMDDIMAGRDEVLEAAIIYINSN